MIEVDISKITGEWPGEATAIPWITRIKTFTKIRLWVVGKEYKFNYTTRSTYFPTSIDFINDLDATAFKLTFEL